MHQNRERGQKFIDNLISKKMIDKAKISLAKLSLNVEAYKLRDFKFTKEALRKTRDNLENGVSWLAEEDARSFRLCPYPE